MRLCVVCGWRPARRWGRCDACSAYLYRTKRDRSEELVVRHGRRMFEQHRS